MPINYYRNVYNFVHGQPQPDPLTELLNCPVSRKDFIHAIPGPMGIDNNLLFKNLKALQVNSNALISNIIVHGSNGDNSTIQFSDLDATLFIPDEVIFSKMRLAQLKNYMVGQLLPFLYSYDPLQHHGFFLLWPSLCASYDEAILPPVVYENSWAVNAVEMKLYCVNNSSKGRFQRFIGNIEKRIKKKKNWSLYQFKNLLSHLLIIPSVYYTEKGCSFLKKESYSPFLSEFPYYQIIYEFADYRRTNWKQSRKFEVNSINKIGCYLFQTDFPRLKSHFDSKIYINKENQKKLLYSLNSIISRCNSSEYL